MDLRSVQERARLTKMVGLEVQPTAESGRAGKGRSRQRGISLPKLARWCERYSPLVGFAEQGEAADLLLDITGIGPLFGGEKQLAEKLAADLATLGYTPRLAIASTIGAAWGLTHYGEERMKDEGGRMNSIPISTSFSSFILHPSSFPTLPVEALRLSPETVELLHQLGVRQIEQLLRLPRESLSARFAEGAEGTSRRCPLLERLDQASGAAAEVIRPYKPPPEFQAEWALEHPVEEQGAVERILAKLAERVARQLAPRRRGAVRLECRLDCAGSEPLVVEAGLFRPSAEPRYLRELLQMRLARQAWPGPVGRVGLQVTLAAPLADRQQELFPDAAEESSRRLALLIDRLSGRLGSEAVLRPRLVPDAQPERACRYVPLAGRRESKGQRGKRTKGQRGGPFDVGRSMFDVRCSASVLPRPLFVFPSPLPVEILAVSSEGPPARFTYRQRSWHIARHWGPERIETGWWRGRSVRRDYYRVETDDGRRYWLFCRLDDGQWFLHGSFV